MPLPVLDLFVLSLLDRGLETPYDLQKRAGLSLGATTPSLRRLLDGKLATRSKDSGSGKRPRHAYELTAKGKEEARQGWKSYMSSERLPNDLDSILRIVDLAVHYKHADQKIADFIRTAVKHRIHLSKQLSTELESDKKKSYPALRSRCEVARLQAEADELAKIAALFSRASGRLASSLPADQKTFDDLES